MRQRSGDDRRRERGTVMVLAALAATALLLFAALVTDVGLVWSSQTQSQNVADAAAMAAAVKLPDLAEGARSGERNVKDAAKAYAERNATVGNPSVKVRNQDVDLGCWDVATRTFDQDVDKSDPDQVTAVQVTVEMDGRDDTNQRSPSFLSRLAGRDGFEVTTRAIAYLGYEGSWSASDFTLPIAIEGCPDSSGCNGDFCAAVDAPPNPCALLDPQQGDGDVSCLDFSLAGVLDRLACFTPFDGIAGGLNLEVLLDRVASGNPTGLLAGDEIHLGTAVTGVVQVLTALRTRFETEGVDRYLPAGEPDSWVVRLPVVACNSCDGSGPAAITGAVCFEIREVPDAVVETVIKGRFLCPNSSDEDVRNLFASSCRSSSPAAPGGGNYGLRAGRAVLVD
jgi:Flp pilus assembly protein TadG